MPEQADSSELVRRGSAPTQLTTESILQRLQITEQFNPKQLELIRDELQRHFDDEGFFRVYNRVGMSIGGYVLESVLGQGGAGEVYRARSETNASEYVAIKLIKQSRSTDRFRREMELVLRLAHPNVVVAYEASDHNEMPYIVMEELSGPDLFELVFDTGPISWQQSIRFIVDAASGLQHAHSRGLVHRDVKPGNLMLDSNRVKVTDLGLAILTGKEDTTCESDFRTHSEIVCGTPEYMAPEQAQSMAAASVASDIYSLGATWYFLLTGQPRIEGKRTRERMKNLTGDHKLKSLDESLIPRNICEVIDKMMAYDPEDRYAAMAEITNVLEGIEASHVQDSLRNCIEILIVEDDQGDMLLTVEMLQRSNSSMNITPAHDLSEAIQIAGENSDVDVVLLDLQLPDSRGVETVSRLRSVVADVPIVVLTGQNDVATGQACISAGADDFACKNDLTPSLLERVIFVTLSRASRRLRTENDSSVDSVVSS